MSDHPCRQLVLTELDRAVLEYIDKNQPTLESLIHFIAKDGNFNTKMSSVQVKKRIEQFSRHKLVRIIGKNKQLKLR